MLNYRVTSFFILFCFSSQSESRVDGRKRLTRKDEIYPTLKLSNSLSTTFGSGRNVTVTGNGTHFDYVIPMTFDELEFECSSNVPVRWISSMSWGDRGLNKAEIDKGRVVTRDGQRFNSTIHFYFKSTENLMNLTCQNMCELLDGPKLKGNDECKSVSFIVDDNNDEEIEDFLPAYVNATISPGQTWTNNPTIEPQRRVGKNEHCAYFLEMDFQRKAYICLRSHNNVRGETGSRIIPCRNPDECSQIFQVDHHCKVNTFSNMTNCLHHNCLSFNVPLTPFVIVCGSGYEWTVARAFYRDKFGRLSIFENETSLRPDKNLIGGVNVVPYDNHDLSLTCEQQPRNPGHNNTEMLPACEGEERLFECFGLKTFFTFGFVWAITFANGNRKELGHGDVVSTRDSSDICKSQKRIAFRVNMTSVVCAASPWNSLDWTNYTIPVNVTKPSKPVLFNSENTTVVVTKGSGPLKCQASAWPPPKYTWKYALNNVDSQDSDKSLMITLNNMTDYTLIHPGALYLNSTSTLWNSGFVITCSASNVAGHAILVRFVHNNVEWTSWGIPSIIFVVILIVLTVVFVLAFIRIRRQKEKLMCLTDEYLEEFKNGTPNGPEALILPYNTELEIPRENIDLGTKVLGSGAFGEVCRGKLGIMTVAVKTLKKSVDVTYLKALMSEIKVMSYVGRNPNIVNLVGACTENIRKREIFVVLEYCEQGDMLSLLRRCRGIFVNYLEPKAVEYERRSFVDYQNASVKKLSTKNIMSWARDIANGMEWISNKNVIHGDLAARNILITRDLDAKVGDFGLSKQLYDYSIYVQKIDVPLPLRWMAYESLKDLEFSIQSDIWSYGVVLWEIFSLGETPYPGIDWSFNSWELILNGQRMQKPKYSTDYVYTLMRECWDIDPQSRPSFKFLKECLESHLSKLTTRNTLDFTYL